MKAIARALADLGPDFVLAPERYVAGEHPAGIPLGDLVEERSERIDPQATPDAVVLDTTHARDGVFDMLGALRDGPGKKSLKKRAHSGDLVISRLRPYLRQIALVHPKALALLDERPLALSTEFYVLVPKRGSLAFLVPHLLSEPVQAQLAAAQEGGHHPRVPRSSLLALRVPESLVRARDASSREILGAFAAYYGAVARLRAQL